MSIESINTEDRVFNPSDEIIRNAMFLDEKLLMLG